MVVKIAGALLDDPEAVRSLARQIAQLAQQGHEVLVIHGGGKIFTATLARLGIESRFINGLRVTDRETRDIADIFAMVENDFTAHAFADPAAGTRDYRAMTDDEVTVAARNRETTAFYAWSPYMHDPKLKARLHRIRIPALVLWGAADRLVSESYGRAFAAAVPGATFEPVPGAGHFPYIEQPKLVAERVLAFVERERR